MENKKVIAPAAINSLIEALTNIYWYKSELRSFIMNTISDPSILVKLNWEDYKRNIVSTLVNFLAKYQDTYQNDLLKLMNEVGKINDFSHLERIEDGKEKAKIAKKSVEALRIQIKGHQDLVNEQKMQEERRQKAYEKTLKVTGVQEKLDKIKDNFYKLVGSDNPQARGFQLEKIIKELFNLFDLDSKASFRITGEQIDGAFTFESTDFLFEGKWQQELVGIQDLDAFSGKLTRKLDNTLGLFLSINGFSEDAVKAHSTGRRLMILMDGSDIMGVLEGRIDLLQLLLRKRRHASQTGNIYLKLHEIIS
jgi:Restriction endonuclease